MGRLRVPQISVFPSHSVSGTWGSLRPASSSSNPTGSCCPSSCMSGWRSLGCSRHLVMDGLSFCAWDPCLWRAGAQSDLEELFSSLDIALKGPRLRQLFAPLPPPLRKGLLAADSTSGFCSVFLEM